MDESYLYQQIAESIRREILEGRLKPGDRLPSVRQQRELWNCTPGTVQRAYNELVREGLLVSRAGRGTQVAGGLPPARIQAQGALRLANLVHRSEAFLLEVLTGGYNLGEVQQALDMAMDRWRALQAAPPAAAESVLRFAGSHDMVLNGIAQTFFGRLAAGTRLELSYSGSLGGLMALAEGRADLAGCHLWDAESDRYNRPFVRRLLPGRPAVLINLAHRRQGLIVAPGNPKNLNTLADLTRDGVRFVNRQPGSGTRVWLDAMLARAQIAPRAIQGYGDERMTHSDVAIQIAEGSADVGLGLETAASAYGLAFVFLTRERYDLVMLAETLSHPAVQQLSAWLASDEGRAFVTGYPGYDASESGTVEQID